MIKHLTRIAAAAAAFLFVFCLGGCSFSALTAENVMEPPQAFGDGAELQATLEEALGPQITLRYPRNGEHRSAVVRADVDSDSHDEAIVFYRPATESSGARMVVLDTDERGEWFLAGEFAEAEGEIDRVIFGDIDGDGTDDIITGWKAYSDYGTIHVHSCSNGTLSDINMLSGAETGARALSSYAELSVGDFDRDGNDELLTVSMAGTDDAGEARLLKWIHTGKQNNFGIIRQVGSVTLTPGAAAYIGSAAGNFAINTYGIAVDSLRTNGAYSSELVLWDSQQQQLVSPVWSDDSTVLTRTLATESCDIDGDGFIEIPGDTLLPDCSAPGAQKVYRTDWYCYNSVRFVRDFSAVMRQDSGYYFLLPDRLQGLITAQPDQTTHTMRFYQVDEQNPFSSELMRLRVFTLDEWEDDESLDAAQDSPAYYSKLYATDYYVYAVRIISNPPGFNLDYNSVLRYFSLLP